jgi:hypothetical protein
MTGLSSALHDAAWDIETNGTTAWAEDVDTMTYGLRLAEPFDPTGITRRSFAPDRVVGVRNDGTKMTPGTWDINFSFSCWWTGRGSSSSGAVSLSDLYRLIGHALGTSAVAAAAGSTLTGGTVNIPTTTASGTWSAGGLIPLGVLGDGDGNGQFHAIATHSAQNMTLLTNMQGAPVNGAVMYAADLAYTAASAGVMTGLRFRFETANLQWVIHGVVITGISISQTNPGETPRITFTCRGSWAEYKAAAFPTASPAAPTANKVSHNASGSCFLASVGTATSTLVQLRQLAINIGLGVSILEGGQGVNANQTITGATRTPDTVTVDASLAAPAATTAPAYADLWEANTSQHMLVTFQSGDQNAVAAYLRNMCWTGNRPSQSTMNGVNVVNLQWMAYNGTTTTNDLTRSMLVLAGA